MFNVLTHFKRCAQINLDPKKHCISSSYAVIKSFIINFLFDIFEKKVENFGVFLKKVTKKEMNFSTSTSNSKMNFYLVINLIMRKRSLNLILWPKKRIVCISSILFDIFSFFNLRQRMKSHFKEHMSVFIWCPYKQVHRKSIAHQRKSNLLT